jgi:gas vesicle protein
MSTSSKVLVAALAGVAIGAAVGILFAPEKGEEMRKRLSRKGKEAKDELLDNIEDGLSSLNSWKKDLLSDVQGAAADVAINAEKAK